MNLDFKEYADNLHSLLERLILMEPCTIETLPKKIPGGGIYLFSENGKHFYVGRTRKLLQRMRNHSGNGSDHNQAVFAFKLAKNRLGLPAAPYTKEGSRKKLAKDPEFSKVFFEERIRVRRMDLRFVELDDPLGQALLEIYVSFVLKTPYNDFDTH